MPDEANLLARNSAGRFTSLDLRRLAELGALARVNDIQEEIARIYEAFPELRRSGHREPKRRTKTAVR